MRQLKNNYLRMKINLIILSVVLLFLSACSTYKYTSRVAETQTGNNISITPSVTDVKIDFSKKITAVSDIQKGQEAARQNAYYKAIKDNSIDILVSPIYEMEIISNGSAGKCKATVTGYAGYFANSRTASEAKKNEVDAKLDALGKMLKLDPITNEKQTTVILGATLQDASGQASVSNTQPKEQIKSKVTKGKQQTAVPTSPNQTLEANKDDAVIINSNPSLLDKFGVLYNDNSGDNQSAPKITANTPVLPSIFSAPKSSVQKKSATSTGYKSPTVAFLMSMVLSGSGQMYNGQIGKGIGMLGVQALGYSLFLSQIESENDSPILGIAGIAIVAINGINSMLDAAKTAKKLNKQHGLTLNWKLDKNTDLALQPDYRFDCLGGGVYSPVVGAKLSLSLH